MEKDWLFYYEGHHPGEQEANAQKVELPDGMCVTDHIEQNHETPWVREFGSARS